MPLILVASGQRIYIRGSLTGTPFLNMYGVLDWQHVKDRAATANLFTFSFPEPCFVDGSRWIPVLREEILIYRNESDFSADRRWFGGMITSVKDATIQNGSAYTIKYKIDASGFIILLDKELRQPQKAGLSWRELLIYLLETHFIGQISTDYSFIVNPIDAPPVRINNGSMRTLLNAMRQLTAYDYEVDNLKKLHVFKAEERTGSFEVDDNPASGRTVWSERPTLSREGQALYNIVHQPFQAVIGINDWPGETFTGKGDPKGQAAIPLLRTPTSIDETTYLDDRFDGNTLDPTIWIENDNNSTQHVDYPNQGYIFPGKGQLQVLGGTGTQGVVFLVSQEYFGFVEASYLVQEFQLTQLSGDGYICAFTDGSGQAPSNIKAGLHVQAGVLKALDGTVLLASIDMTINYLLWVTMTVQGFQYDIQGGVFTTKQTLRTETFTHLTNYKIAPIINGNLHCSINSCRLRQSDRGVILEINGVKKVVGLESSDTDLPDIDAFLNIDETPALIKYRAASALNFIVSVSSNTVFTVQSGSGSDFRPGIRLLIGVDIVENFNGRETYVLSVSGDVVTLKTPGLSGMTAGNAVLVGTTLPAKGDTILVRYPYSKQDEATAYDQDSINKYGNLPTTLDQQDQIRTLTFAQMQAENYLTKYRDGITNLDFVSNDTLIPVEPNPMTAISVRFSKRPDIMVRQLILQRIECSPIGKSGINYSLHLESADPVTPLEDVLKGRSLVIGSDGEIRFSLNLTEQAVSTTDLSIRKVTSKYITWNNPEGRKYGEFYWKP